MSVYIGEKFDVATNKEYKKQDGYAGMFGKAIDRLQITISWFTAKPGWNNPRL